MNNQEEIPDFEDDIYLEGYTDEELLEIAKGVLSEQSREAKTE